jgi:phosphatidylglycerol:prolipoprotein diacylglycerol transferase
MWYIAYQVLGALLWLVAFYSYLRRRAESANLVFGIDLAFSILVAGLMGGRFFYMAYEAPHLFRQDPWSFFRLWEGGFVFYGGFLAAALVAYLLCIWLKQSFWFWADELAPFLSAGYIWGRVGCFLQGCCYGEYCDLPWAVEGRHPTQLYAALTEVFVLLWLISERRLANTRVSGGLFLKWVIAHSLMRILFMEPFRGDDRGAMPLGLSISTWIGWVLVLTSAALLIWRSPSRSNP